jgi:hypothetical protein
LKQVGSLAAPAIVALVPETAAGFLHVPGPTPAWQRFTLQHVPADVPHPQLGSFSGFQQREELALLRGLAAAPAPGEAIVAGVAGVAPSGGNGDTVDRLANWLLVQASPDGEGHGGAETAAAGVAADPIDKLAGWLLSQADLSGT